MKQFIKLSFLAVLATFIFTAVAYGQSSTLSSSPPDSIKPFLPLGHFTTPFVPKTSQLEMGGEDTMFVFVDHNSTAAARSHTQGHLWEQISLPHNQYSALSAAISPLAGDGLMLIGSDSYLQGLWISNDYGRHWHQPTPNISHDVKSVVFSPNYQNDRQIFATTTVPEQRIIRSHDEGEHWQVVATAPFPIARHLALAPNYATSQTMIAAVGASGVWRSDNGGQNWTPIDFGLHLEYNNEINKVYFSPNFAQDNTIFALGNYGLYRTIDGGQRWIQILPYVITDFAPHPNYHYGGGNATFFFVATVEINNEQFDVLFRTLDGSETYEGMVAYVQDFELSQGYPANGTMYALTDFGLVQSTNNGESWYMNAPTPSEGFTQGLIASPTFESDSTVFALYMHISTIREFEVWKSDNFGASWDTLSLPEEGENNDQMRLAVSNNYANDQTLVLLYSEYNQPAALYKSTNSGQTWELLNNSLPFGATRDPDLKLSPNFSNDQTIFVSDYESGMFRSTDNGQTWQQLSDNFSITSMGIPPNYPSDQRLYFTEYSDGLFRSDDNGNTWTELTNTPHGLRYLIGFSSAFAQDNTMFLTNTGSNGGDVWRSNDGGNNWTEAHTGGVGWQTDMAVSPNYAQNQTLVVQNPRQGLSWSEDGGETWFPLDGLIYDYYNTEGYVALPTWQGRPLPITQTGSGIYFYTWPSQVQATFGCQQVVLGAAEPQSAYVHITADSLNPAGWSVDTSTVPWLDIVQDSGMAPNRPQLLIDSSGLTDPVSATFTVDVYLSYRQYETVNVQAFAPCFSTNLPVIQQ